MSPLANSDCNFQICRLLRDENFIPNYEAAAYDAIQAGFIEKRYFWMVALASLCVRDNEAELEEELRDKICRIFHKINRDPIQYTWKFLQNCHKKAIITLF